MKKETTPLCSIKLCGIKGPGAQTEAGWGGSCSAKHHAGRRWTCKKITNENPLSPGPAPGQQKISRKSGTGSLTHRDFIGSKVRVPTRNQNYLLEQGKTCADRAGQNILGTQSRQKRVVSFLSLQRKWHFTSYCFRNQSQDLLNVVGKCEWLKYIRVSWVRSSER